ncbi:surface antigen [Plasmodium falciparum UGT5.1]|uniref:Surface antigen n=1 Tax=Plasmodium falciparum UGT5.1 TaxID=1237627 RepID=W7K4I7_PLAFA|nr:surface antigen [Plasmodium falciparum UGT5.1]
MKSVMQQFHDRTKQRFQEYDEMLQEKRQICKDTCDKEIQKIILKDKIEKELKEKLARLETNITTEDLPICECEKSLADKMEKGCLRCGGVLGGGVMPGFGAIGGTALYTLCQWQNKAIAAATEYALAKGAAKGLAAGIQAGKNAVIDGLNALNIGKLHIGSWEPYFAEGYCIHVKNLANVIYVKRQTMCGAGAKTLDTNTCNEIGINIGTIAENGSTPPPGITPIETVLNGIVEGAEKTAEAKTAQVSSATSSKIITKQTDVINTIYMSNQTAIIASIIAIVIIVLIMVIIYLILRYRRKKKTKKKLQYIKLLEE